MKSNDTFQYPDAMVASLVQIGHYLMFNQPAGTSLDWTLLDGQPGTAIGADSHEENLPRTKVRDSQCIIQLWEAPVSGISPAIVMPIESFFVVHPKMSQPASQHKTSKIGHGKTGTAGLSYQNSRSKRKV
jgi:hypothetical protein